MKDNKKNKKHSGKINENIIRSLIGVGVGVTVKAVDAYNESKKKSAAVASAGNSVHGIALAIDIGELYRAAGGVGAAEKNGIAINRRVRENSKLYQYLAKTGPSFGWYNPYRLADNAGTVDECWHFEYWGYYKK
jgi:hypothetical protein